jgi:hypothetical protein
MKETLQQNIFLIFFRIFFTKWLKFPTKKKTATVPFAKLGILYTNAVSKSFCLAKLACFLHPKLVVKYSAGGVALSSLGLSNGVSWFFTCVVKNLQFGF